MTNFLNARPWSERGSCYGRGLSYFIFFVWPMQTALGHAQTSNDATYDVYSSKAVKTLMYWIFYFLFCANYLAFLCYWSTWFEARGEYSKYICHSWIVSMLQLFLWSPLNKIVLVLTFISPGATVIDATVIFWVFFVVLDKNSDLSCCRDLSRSEGKLNICKPSKERIRTCNEYVILKGK